MSGPALAVAAVLAAASPISAQRVPDDSRTVGERELAVVTAVAKRLADPAAAASAGFRRIAPRAIRDLNPLLGEHWLNDHNLRLDSLDLRRPAYAMYYPLGLDRVTLVGLAYGVAQPSGSAPPAGFDGDADIWHIHHSCHDLEGLGSALVEDADDCRGLGGRPGAQQIAMVHVWLDPPNPEGPFAPFNVALPYVATGLTPPTADNLADLERGRRLRALGLALGETFGAVPRLGGLVDHPRNLAFRERAAPHRARIAAILPQLREADRSGDRGQFDQLADLAIAEWDAIRRAYLDAADSPALKALLDRWFAAALGSHGHGEVTP